MTTPDMLLRLGAGLGLGLLIGLERQYRARMAGLRTNALVAAGAALFVLLSAHGFSGGNADPARVAAQIVSGIGFLGGGVILKEGLTLRSVGSIHTEATDEVEVRASLTSGHRYDKQMESAVGRLSLEPSVLRVRWDARPADSDGGPRA